MLTAVICATNREWGSRAEKLLREQGYQTVLCWDVRLVSWALNEATRTNSKCITYIATTDDEDRQKWQRAIDKVKSHRGATGWFKLG